MTAQEWKSLTDELSAIYAKVKEQHEMNTDMRPVPMMCWLELHMALCSVEFYMRELGK